MRSPMIETAGYIPVNEKSFYSDLQVLKSNAGWYVGTIFIDPTLGFSEPGSRDSCYFNTKEEADEFLNELINGNEDALLLLRTSP